MAPLGDLIDLFLIALKDSLDTAIPAIFNPAFYPQFKSCLLSVVTKENPLDPSLNDDPRPDLLHIDYVMDVAPPFIGGDPKPFRRQ